jgi:predicted Zn-dependent peptidase
MKAIMKLKKKRFFDVVALGILTVSINNASAKIYLDPVLDPLPLVEFQVVIPQGTNNSDLKNLAAAGIVDVMLESGTKSKNKQQLNDALAAFGANASLNIGSEFSYFNVSFPYIESKNYDELFVVLAEAINEPRFDKPTFDLAKRKYKSAINSLLDNDGAMVRSLVSDWQYFKTFNRKPMTIEDIDALTLKEVEAFYNEKLLASEDIWVGLVVPPAAKNAFVDRISKLFSKQGPVSEGQRLESMVKERTMKKAAKASKTFLIIDKKERTQNVFAMNSLLTSDLDSSKELGFRFGNFLLVGASFGSVFYDVIRNQNGFSYNISPFESKLLGRPSFGFTTNPVAARAIDAFKTIADLTELYYGSSEEGFSKFSDELWAARLQSYKYAEIMGRSSDIKKLMRRKLVVLGEISPAYYKANPQSWNVDKKDVIDVYKGLFDKSQVVAGAVGDASGLESLVRLNFPDFKIIKVAHKDVITAKPFKQ